VRYELNFYALIIVIIIIIIIITTTTTTTIIVILQQFHSPHQSEFSTQCEILLSLSIYSIFKFPLGHPVAAYVFLLVSPSLVSFILFFLQ
jgi:hypothetical protein